MTEKEVAAVDELLREYPDCEPFVQWVMENPEEFRNWCKAEAARIGRMLRAQGLIPEK